MRSKKRIIGITFLLLIILSGLFFTLTQVKTQQPTQKVTLRFSWWGTGQRNEKYIQAINAFEKKHPTVKIEYDYYTWEDYWKNSSAAMANHQAPDVMQMDVMYLAQYSQKGYLADLTPYLDQQIKTKDITQPFLNDGKINQKLYGLTSNVNAVAAIVNPKILAAAGIKQPAVDFEQWIQQMKQVTVTTGKTGYIDNSDIYVPFQYYLRTKKKQLFTYDQNGKPSLGFTEADFTAYFDGMRQLYQAGALQDPDITKNIKSMDEHPLANGAAAYQQNWAQMYDWYQKAAKRHDQKLALTRPFGADQGALTYHPAIMYSITKSSQHKKLAAELIDYLTNDEKAAKDYLGLERGLPANTKIQQALYPQLNSTEKEVFNYLRGLKKTAGANSNPPPDGFIALNNEMNRLFTEVCLGKMTGAEAYQAYVTKFQTRVVINYP